MTISHCFLHIAADHQMQTPLKQTREQDMFDPIATPNVRYIYLHTYLSHTH